MMKSGTDTEPASPSHRGEESRARILRAALDLFGREGFEGATTRRIAAAAGASLPAIRYYFDSKEGLYLACAREIVARYEAGIGGLVAKVAGEVAALDPDAARARLKAIMAQLAALISGDDDTGLWTGFVLREMTEPGPAFEILYRELWQPGVELTAYLIARIGGRKAPNEADRVEALLLHASLTAFSTTRPVSLRFLGSAEDGGEHGLDLAIRSIDDRIDALGR